MRYHTTAGGAGHGVSNERESPLTNFSACCARDLCMHNLLPSMGGSDGETTTISKHSSYQKMEPWNEQKTYDLGPIS